MRKIDNTQILTLLREGNSQAEIARILGVSAVAVHKRLRRIMPKPESLERLTLKEKRFAIAVAKGKSRTAAAMEAYDVSSRDSAKSLQTQLMAKDDVKMAIQEMMQIYGLTRGYRVHRLKHHVDSVDPTVSLRALEACFRLDGFREDPALNNFPTTINIVVVGGNKQEEVSLTTSAGENIGSPNSVIDITPSLHSPATPGDNSQEGKE